MLIGAPENKSAFKNQSPLAESSECVSLADLQSLRLSLRCCEVQGRLSIAVEGVDRRPFLDEHLRCTVFRSQAPGNRHRSHLDGLGVSHCRRQVKCRLSTSV